MIVFDIDPNVVKPGWTPLIIIVVLGAVMVLLYRSMRRQFSKIQAPPAADPTSVRASVGSELRRPDGTIDERSGADPASDDSADRERRG